MAVPVWKTIANMLLEEARLGCAPGPSEAAFFNRNGCLEADVSKFLADLGRIAAQARAKAEMQTRCMKGDVRM